MASHHYLEEELTASLRQLLHSEVVNDQQVGLQVSRHHSVVAVHRFVVQEVAYDIKDRTIQHHVPQLDQMVADALNEMTLASTVAVHLLDRDMCQLSFLELLELTDTLPGAREQIAAVNRVFVNSDRAVADLAIKP